MTGNARLFVQSCYLLLKILIVFALSNSSITNFVYQNF